jgi:NTP pyrophosphatase (non-canonical NTP hydrolase)
MDTTEIEEKIIELEEVRGFSHETVPDKVICLKEEVDEFLEAIKGNGDIADEGIDVINSVVMIFRRRGITLGAAFLNKYEKDKRRV